MKEHNNIVFMGSLDVGKSLFAIAIGVEAASLRYSTYFISFSTLMAKIKKAISEQRIEQIKKHYLKYSLLLIDEIGYLPTDRDASYVCFINKTPESFVQLSGALYFRCSFFTK